MELSIDRGCPNARGTPVNPSAAGIRPRYARGRLVPSVAERLQPTTCLQFLRGVTLSWNAAAADSTSQRRSRKTSRPGTVLASHATSVARPSESWRQSGRLTRTRVEFSRGMLTAAQKGRIRSAERTEVHLMTTIRFDELAFCPSMRTSGAGKEVRHAGKTPSIEPQPRSSQVSS